MARNCVIRLVAGVALAGSLFSSPAHEGEHPSVHDTVAGIVERLKRELKPEQLTSLTITQVLDFILPAERDVLAQKHVRFRLNVPAVVTVVHDMRLGDDPFWLKERGFTQAAPRLKVG